MNKPTYLLKIQKYCEGSKKLRERGFVHYDGYLECDVGYIEFKRKIIILGEYNITYKIDTNSEKTSYHVYESWNTFDENENLEFLKEQLGDIKFELYKRINTE